MTRRRAVSRGSLRIVAVVPLLVLLLLAVPGAMATAADPSSPAASPVASPIASPGGDMSGPVDSRSEGSGPGFQAEPLVVLFAVLALGLAAAGGTWLYVRLTRED